MSIYITQRIIILLCIFYGQFCLLLYVSHFIRRFSSLVENWASHRCRFDAGQDSVLWSSTKIWRNENNRNVLYRSTRKHNNILANASAFYPAHENITLIHLLSRSHYVLSIDCAPKFTADRHAFERKPSFSKNRSSVDRCFRQLYVFFEPAAKLPSRSPSGCTANEMVLKKKTNFRVLQNRTI